MAELVDPKNFKTYEELKSKLDMVLGSKTAPTAESISQPKVDAEDEQFMEKVKNVQASPVSETSSAVEDDDDDTLSYFKSLAEDD